jgi:hypothetical protein
MISDNEIEALIKLTVWTLQAVVSLGVDTFTVLAVEATRASATATRKLLTRQLGITGPEGMNPDMVAERILQEMDREGQATKDKMARRLALKDGSWEKRAIVLKELTINAVGPYVWTSVRWIFRSS